MNQKLTMRKDDNIKISTMRDILFAEAVLKSLDQEYQQQCTERKYMSLSILLITN